MALAKPDADREPYSSSTFTVTPGAATFIARRTVFPSLRAEPSQASLPDGETKCSAARAARALLEPGRVVDSTLESVEGLRK